MDQYLKASQFGRNQNILALKEIKFNTEKVNIQNVLFYSHRWPIVISYNADVAVSGNIIFTAPALKQPLVVFPAQKDDCK